MTANCLGSISPVIAAKFPAYPDIGENMFFIFAGFAFVLVVLLALSGVTSLIGAAITRTGKDSHPSSPAPVVRSSAPSPTSDETALFAEHSNPEHVPALIAAAVHTVLQGRKHRIKGVRIASGRWAQEGRRDIFSSHRVR